MKISTLAPTPDTRRVFTSCLLAFSILITPIAAMAAKRGPVAGSQRSGSQSAPANESSKTSAKDVFVNPPVAAPPVGSVTATMTGTITTDVDSDTKADPGVDTITYTTTITNNTGADVSGLQFTDTVDPHTTIIAGSAVAAGDDAYSTIGNVNINVPLGTGVLGNDFNPNTGNNTGLTVTSYGASTGLEQTSVGSSTPTAQGGTVTIQSDGSFTFDPKVGFTGTDTFRYASNQSGSKAIATVRVTVTGRMWFVKNAGAAGGACSSTCDGRLSHPFQTLAALQAVNGDAAVGHPQNGDSIFIYESTTDYVGPVTLRSTQKFIGQDATATIETITGLSTPSGSTVLPAMNATPATITNITGSNANAINLGIDNLLRGFTVGNTGTGTKISGVSFGTLTVGNSALPDVTLNGTGQALNLSTGTLSVAGGFVSVATTSSAAQGINLAGISDSDGAGGSSFSFGSPTMISGFALGCLTVGTTTADLNFGTTSCTLGGLEGVNLSNNSAGTRTFGALTVSGISGTAFIHGSAGGDVNITGAASFTTAGNDISVSAPANGDLIDFQSTTSATTSGNGVTAVNWAGAAGATMQFSSLSIQRDNGIALNATTGGTVTVNNTGSASTINNTTAGGPAIVANGIALNANFNSINSSGGTNAVSLTSVTGTSNFGTGALSGSTGATFLVSGGTASVTYSGGITQATASQSMVSVSNGHATGTLSFQGTLSASNGTGLQFNNADGIYNFNTSTGTTTLNGGDAGIDITNGSGGSFTFGKSGTPTSFVITKAAAGNAFDVDGSGTAVTASVTYNGNISETSTGAMVNVNTHSTGTITFDANGTLSANNGPGIQLSNADGTYNFNGTNTLNGGDAGVDILSGSGGIFSFSSSTTITSPTGIGVNISSGTPVVKYDGTITQANGNPAVTITGVTGGNTAGIASPYSIVFTNTITKNTTAANAINVTSNTGGSFGFTGSVTASTSTANAVNLATNTGATITFTGTMGLTTTTGTGFNATGGGTVNATGASSTVTSTGGIGVNIVSTTIGASNVKFFSVNANGGNAGIFLDTTGNSGSFTLTGTVGSTTRDGSGGTIQNQTGADGSSSGHGIYLNSTKSPSIAHVNIQHTGGDGVHGNAVSSGFTMSYCNVTAGAGQDNGTTTAQLGNFHGEGDVQFVDLTGAVQIDHNSMDHAFYNTFAVFNVSGGSLNRIVFSNNTFGDNNLTNGNIGVALQAQGGTMNVTFGADASTANSITGAGADTFVLDLHGVCSSDLIMKNNSLTNGHTPANIVTGGGGASLQSGGVGDQVTLTFNVDSNTFTGAKGVGFFIGTGQLHNGDNFSGTFNNNTIGNAGVTDSGSIQGDALFIQNFGSTTNINVTNNQLHQYNPNGAGAMEFDVGDDGGHIASATYDVHSNTISNPGSTVNVVQGIALNSGPTGTDVSKTCFTLYGNSVTGSGKNGGSDIRLRQRANTNVSLRGNGVGYGGAVNDTTAVNTFAQAQQSPATPSVTSLVTNSPPHGFFGTCPVPLMLAPGGIDAVLTAPSLAQQLFESSLSVPRLKSEAGNSRISSSLTQPQLDSIVDAATDRWSNSGLTAGQQAELRQIKFEVGDLSDSYLGEADGNRIVVDRNAQAKGWFIDATPRDDSEFATKSSTTRRYTDPINAAAGRVDLLTAIEHEMGHKLGLADSYLERDRDSIMYGYLTVGERRTPAAGEARNARPEAISGAHHLTLKDAEVRGQKSEVSKANVRSQTSDVRLNHARSAKIETRNSKLNTAMTPFATCSPAGISGDLKSICVDIPTIHDGQSITISFQVTVNNPPNLSGVPPGTPQVTNFGTVTGPFAGSPLNTNTINTPVDLFNSTTNLVSNNNPANQGDSITFTATVAIDPSQSPTPPSPLSPTGTVTFKSDAVAIGTCTSVALTPGGGGTATAQCTISTLTPPSHNITADYFGDGNYDPSTSNTVSQTVNACGSNTVVTNTNDSGAGSLRDAITNICGSPNNNITFNIPGADPNHSGGIYTITLTTGELAITKDVKITGPNSTTNTDPIIINGNNNGRVFNLPIGKTATISNLNVTGGNGNGGNGGGIVSAGTLNLIGMAIYGNTATGQNGGGIYNNTSGTLRIINSTLSGNSALLGGGVYNDGTLVLTNATISANTAANFGGGLYNNGTGTFTMNNTIVAGNTVEDIHTGSGAMSGDYNLIGDTTGITGGPSGSNNVLNQTANLGSLAFNGGVSKTMALLANSPAIEAGNNALAVDQTPAALTTDQRGTGFPRIADSADANTTATVDIGAFELHPSIQDIANQSTAEDTALPVNFNIGDDVSSGGTLIQSVAATSSNTSLVTSDNVHLAITGSGGSRTLTITPNPDANSPANGGTTTITVTVTATNGRTAVDTFDLTVTEVNDAPTANNDTVPDILEDSGTYSIPISTLLSNDSKGPANESGQTLSVTGLSNFTGGNAVVNGSNIDFSPTANYSGPAGFDYTIQDNGTTAGSDDFKTSTAHVSFNITAVNDAPAGADKTVTILEDNSYTFAAADFGFTDPNDTPPNTLSAVKITTLPGAGTLTDNNIAVSAGQSIPVADINGGLLKFTPTADANGTPYASFTFQVQDNGTTNNGGVDLDQSPNTMTINVTAVNDAPAGADKTVTILEDNSYTFAAADFGFTDPNDTPANTLSAVKITTLPGAGTLTDNNIAVSAGQSIPVADINGGLLKFTPAANGSGSPYTTFTFQVQDDGTTNNGGVDLDQSPNTMTINVTAVNDAPAGADKTVTINEDNSYTFAAADFGFTDPNDTPANTLSAVKITTLPGAGTLTDNNVAVSAGQSIPVADINGGLLKFTPAADANGTPYASFTFQVQDDGTTNNGGVDLDQSPNTMTINVTAVNDAPAGADKTVATTINTPYIFTVADFGFTDPNDTPANTLSAVKITTLPAAGTLTDNNIAVVAGQSIPVADINGGLLKFTPAANSSGSPYTTFTFQVQDDGTTNNGGVDLDQSPNTMTINVGQPTLSVLDAVRAEPTSGTANMLFTVTMNPQLASQTVTVDYQTANGGATPATSGTCGNPGVDYQPTSGTLTFNPGETTKTIKVSICSDNVNESDETFLLNLSNASGATISRPQATGTIKQANVAGTFIISEIRTSGPAGLGDDFVELYNNTDSSLTVAASDASAGYGVFKMGANCNAAPVLIATIPNGTVIPARGHYLLVGSQYSLANYGGAGAAAGDQTLTSDIESDRNVGLFNTADVNSLSTVTRLDAVGFGTNSDGVTTGVCDLLREGTNLPPLSGSTTEHSFFRKECDFNGTGCNVNGTPKDTNDNNADFMFADTQGTFISGVPQALGAPGPQNKTSGIQRNSTIVMPLLDSSLPASAVPNRDRTFTPNPPMAPNGVLAIRRRIQNNTGGDVTALRFRIVDITTFPSPGGGQADLRATTSSDVVISNIHDTTTCVDRVAGTASNCTVNVKGTTLETPPNQPNGGGYNSSMRVDLSSLPGNKLAANQSVEIQLAFGVVQGGHFRVLVNVEDDVVGGDPSKPGMTLASFVEEVAIGADQTISFDPVANRTFGDGDFNVSASASSGLPVSYASNGNCAVTGGGNVHLTGAGACTITASQAGDSTHNPVTTQQAFIIGKGTPATSVTSSLNAAKLTQNVTFAATVAAPANTTAATGTVQFRDNGVDLGPAVALDANGQATFSTASLAAGSHSITVQYSGNSNFNASSSTLAQVVTNRPLVNFAIANYDVKQSDGFVRVLVNRTGDLSVPVTVDYATDGSSSGNCAGLRGVASLRCDVTAMYGTFRFAAGETQKTLDIPINQDSYNQGPETFTVTLSNAMGPDALLVTPAAANITIDDAASPTPNAIDDTTIFVRQQYHDFLNREPDAAGLAFWKNNIDVCNTDATEAARYGGATACIERKRVYTSGAFFLSIEFRGTGGLVRDFYVAALDRPASGNMPGFVEFTRDTQAVQHGVVVGQTDWQRTLDANRAAFMTDFVMRPEFVGLYSTTDTPAQYVDKLYQHSNVTPGNSQERLDAIAEFGSATFASDPGARGRALLRITQNGAFQSRELNRGFVQMQYFGYLRRNPNDDPDSNLNGFSFWLNKLNQFNGDYVAAEMVKAFLSSGEYRQRFGTP